jgi:hypothetical protein
MTTFGIAFYQSNLSTLYRHYQSPFLRIKPSSSRCTKCGTKLSSAAVNDAELVALKAAVLGDVITRSDIYCNSTPQEHQVNS